jgi:hypothetical protein
MIRPFFFDFLDMFLSLPRERGRGQEKETVQISLWFMFWK